MLILISSLHAQPIQLIMQHESHTDTLALRTDQVDSLINGNLEALWSQGYWNAKIDLEADTAHPQALIAVIRRGELAHIAQVHFSEAIPRDEPYLQQEFKMGRASIAVGNISQAENRLKDMGYYFKGAPAISRDTQGAYHLDYDLKDYPELNLDVMAAFNQAGNSDSVSWYGHVNVTVPNLDGRGKSIRINWKRLEANSEYFLFGYGHPWILGMPLSGQLSYGREVVDGQYQVIIASAGLTWNVSWERSLIFKYEDYQSLITHEGALLNPEWRATRRRMLGLGYRQSTLDHGNHKGLALRTTFDQELNFEPASVTRFNLRSEFERAFLSKLYFSQRTALILQNETTAQRDPSLLEPLGGLNSVRGYEANYLRSPSVFSLQHELHLVLGRDSQILAMVDLGFYDSRANLQHLLGYGLGVELRSGRGPIRLTLASHSGLALRNSFLHIEYSRGLSWIDQ